MAKLSVLLGFTKWVSMDVLYLKINDVLEYNLPYVQSNFMYNPGPKGYYDPEAEFINIKGHILFHADAEDNVDQVIS